MRLYKHIKISWPSLSISGLLFGIMLLLMSCTSLRRYIVGLYSYDTNNQAQAAAALKPHYDRADAKRPHLAIQLNAVAAGYHFPTDIQFIPGIQDAMVVLEKGGKLNWFDLRTNKRGVWAKLNVLTASEEGLLGLAFHPKFLKNGRFFLNYVVQDQDKDTTHISEWRVNPKDDWHQWHPKEEKVILKVTQPYANHNAGQLLFGADGYLYVGLGDGGWRDDPHDNGQNPKSFLGKMLRIDIDHPTKDKAYAIPPDNPFINNPAFLPEIWAYGFRNPWHYTFDTKQRLIVADVGQDHWEEVSIVERGGNYGWNIYEGTHCFHTNPQCKQKTKPPIVEYSHEEGISITGGYVYLNDEIPTLKNKYIFGDFGSGRLWAITLPQKTTAFVPSSKRISLGRWPLQISTFGRDRTGSVYLADFNGGVIYRISKP